MRRGYFGWSRNVSCAVLAVYGNIRTRTVEGKLNSLSLGVGDEYVLAE